MIAAGMSDTNELEAHQGYRFVSRNLVDRIPFQRNERRQLFAGKFKVCTPHVLQASPIERDSVNVGCNTKVRVRRRDRKI
jgi:uncharacterized protein YaiL (DUF2058 family)